MNSTPASGGRGGSKDRCKESILLGLDFETPIMMHVEGVLFIVPLIVLTVTVPIVVESCGYDIPCSPLRAARHLQAGIRNWCRMKDRGEADSMYSHEYFSANHFMINTAARVAQKLL